MRALAVYSPLLWKLDSKRNFLNFKHTRQPDVCYDTYMLAYDIVLKSRLSRQNKEMLMISTLCFHHFLSPLLLFPLPIMSSISMMLTYSQIRVQAIYFPSVVQSCDRTTVPWKLQLSVNSTALRLHYIWHWLKNKQTFAISVAQLYDHNTVLRKEARWSRI